MRTEFCSVNPKGINLVVDGRIRLKTFLEEQDTKVNNSSD